VLEILKRINTHTLMGLINQLPPYESVPVNSRVMLSAPRYIGMDKNPTLAHFVVFIRGDEGWYLDGVFTYREV
jgi:hypothetical protein